MDDGESGQRRVRCRLDDGGATGGQSGTDLAGGHGGREVPRGDHHTDPDRLEHGHDSLVPRRSETNLASDPGRLLGEPAEELGGVPDFAESVRECLAVLEDNELGQVVLSLAHRLEGPTEDLGALTWRRGRPRPQCARGRIDGIPGMAGLGQADIDQHVPGGRVDDR